MYVAATKKFKVDTLIVKDILHSFSHFEVVLILPEIIDRAIDCQVLNKIPFWDALLVSAAQRARCEKIGSPIISVVFDKIACLRRCCVLRFYRGVWILSCNFNH